MRVVIIDGNNLLHKISGLKSLLKENPDAAYLSLYESLKTKLNRNEKLILVFDGFSNIQSKNIIFSGAITADEVIRKYIEDNYERQKIALVSSDNGIKSIAEKCGCEILNSEDFIVIKKKEKSVEQLLKKDDEKPAGMSKKDFDFFKKSFS